MPHGNRRARCPKANAISAQFLLNQNSGRPLPPLVRAKGRVLPRPRALGGPGRRGLGRVPGSGRALVRRLLVEGAWVLARGNLARRKGGGAPVPLAIPGHARACPGRLLGRRRGLVSRGPVPREANAATAAEMARMPPRVGRDAQEAAALAAEVALVA